MCFSIKTLFLSILIWTLFVGQSAADSCSSETECFDAFSALILGKGSLHDPLAAQASLEKACELGTSGLSCHVLGVFVANDVFETEQTADSYFEAGCRRDNPDACAEFARRSVLLSPKVVTDARVLDPLYESCLRGDPLVCAYAGLSLQDRFAQSPDLCESGDERHCALAGWFALNTQADKIKATEFFRRACDAGQADACYLMADPFVTGASEADGLKALRRACSLGHVTACNGVISILSSEVAPELAQACEKSGHPTVCARSAFWSDANIEVAVELFEQACFRGDGEACFLAANDGLFYLSDFKETLDDLAQKDPPRTTALVDLGLAFSDP